jgi:hypothetical protein
VIYSIERVKAAYRPYSTHERGNRILYIYICLLFLIFFGIYYPFSSFFLDYFYFTISTIIAIVVDSLVPIVIIMAANILVFLKLKRNLNALKLSMTGSSQSDGEAAELKNLRSNIESEQYSDNLMHRKSSYQILKRRKHELKKTAFSLFAISFEFCLFNMPYTIYMILTLVNERIEFSWTSGLEDFGKISFQLNLLNQSANFILYFVHISSFRTEFFYIFKRCCKCFRCDVCR